MTDAWDILPKKPLNKKAYGHIPHLPNSRMGPGDHSCSEGQARICCEKYRDKKDTIIVQEKLDGSCVSVAKINGVLVPLVRSGYLAISSKYDQHRMFAAWVYERLSWFEFLRDNERICGEWLAQAHGTRYQLRHDPFVAFDVIRNDDRILHEEFCDRVNPEIVKPYLIRKGLPISITDAMSALGEFGRHGSLDRVEGCVWRVEREGKVDFLTKYVRPDKIDGCYLPEVSKKEAIWNWRP